MKGFFNSEQEDVNALENRHPRKSKPQVFGEVISGGKKVRDYPEQNTPPITPCQCKMEEGAGSIFCNRHQCMKSRSLHGLCKNRMAYFEMWENGEGPMQDRLSQIMASSYREDEKRKIQEQIQEQMGAFKAEKHSGFFMGDLDIPSESRGLGDTLAKITKATGIKKVVDTVFNAINKDCGCRERQSKLNKLFPYKKEEAKKNKTKGFFE